VGSSVLSAREESLVFASWREGAVLASFREVAALLLASLRGVELRLSTKEESSSKVHFAESRFDSLHT